MSNRNVLAFGRLENGWENLGGVCNHPLKNDPEHIVPRGAGCCWVPLWGLGPLKQLDKKLGKHIEEKDY
jgi:hypothetical protein